jgi:hypothetical protein
MYSLIITCKLNDIDPHAWLADVLACLAGYPSHRHSAAQYDAYRLPNAYRIGSASPTIEEGISMKCKSKLIVSITSALAVLGSAAVYAQGKYSLVTTSGIAFSDFRGYEDWAVVSSARTDEVLKVIVANPTMIAAYRAGVPGNGQPFPDGSEIAKLQWKPKKSTEAPFAVDVPDVFTQAFVMEKNSKRFPNSGGWGYALFNYDAVSDAFTADSSPSDCGNTCHVAVKVKDYIFHPYEKR